MSLSVIESSRNFSLLVSSGASAASIVHVDKKAHFYEGGVLFLFVFALVFPLIFVPQQSQCALCVNVIV